MSSAYLPISERWHHYVRQSDDLAQELEEETARALGNQVGVRIGPEVNSVTRYTITDLSA